MYITRLASNEIFSPSNKIHREVGRAQDLTAPLYEELSGIWSKMFVGLHVTYPLFLPDFNETWIFEIDFRKYLNIKFHENSSSGSRVVPCGRAGGRTDRQTDMTKLIVAFRNSANAPNNELGRMCKEAVVIRFEVILLFRHARRTTEGNHKKNSCHDNRSRAKFESTNFRVRSRRDKISMGYLVQRVQILVWIHREEKHKVNFTL